MSLANCFQKDFNNLYTHQAELNLPLLPQLCQYSALSYSSIGQLSRSKVMAHCYSNHTSVNTNEDNGLFFFLMNSIWDITGYFCFPY